MDHPEGTEVFVNDFTRAYNTKDMEPAKIYTTRNLRPVKQAKYINNPVYKGVFQEQDITDLVSEIDYNYAPASLFDDNQYILDLGDLTGAEEIKLVVAGWSKFASISERKEWLEAGTPTAERAMDVMGADGEWITVEKDVPYIPGLTKTAVYDLTGLFPEDVKEYKVRIRGLFRTYFDYAAIDTSVTEEVKVQELLPIKAELKYLGRSPYIEKPEPTFDFYNTDTGPRRYHQGNFTRYGDVLPLLQKSDDMFVITDTGDAIELEFDEPPVEPGMVRSYIFVGGGCFQERTGKVDPLPFHAMTNYPYPDGESYPQVTGQGSEYFCQGCHAGDVVNTWHGGCKSCHNDPYRNTGHGSIPYFNKNLISNCLTCHGHNKSFNEPTGCVGSGCHGSWLDGHRYPNTF